MCGNYYYYYYDYYCAGDNVGTDEYPDDDSYDWFFTPTEMFAVTDVSSGHVVAFIAIGPCQYARGLDTCLAHLNVFRSSDIASDWTAFQSLVRLAVQLTVKLELGYTECVYSACLTCPELLRTLRAEQFTIKAILPKSINIVGKGLRENVIMTKDLGLPHRPVSYLYVYNTSISRHERVYLYSQDERVSNEVQYVCLFCMQSVYFDCNNGSTTIGLISVV